MEKIVRALLDIRDIKFSVDDDFTDRLNRQYTSSLLVMCAILVSARQYMGDPIHCWCPEQCAPNHEKYANIFCWVSNTYYVDVDERLPEAHEPKRRITYYQWVPLILMAQASLFFLPCITWRFLNRRSGINISIIIESAKASQRAVYAEAREKTLRYTVYLIDRYLLAQRDTRRGCLVRFKHVLSRHCFLVYGKFYGNYLTFTYLMIKVIYVLNAVGQLFLLDLVLGYEFHLFGLHVMKHIINGSDWSESVRFPRVTLCDFHIRHQTNVHRYTFQCVLPINVFNEKVFFLVWCWLLLVALATLCSFIHWLKKSIYWPTQLKFVKRQLRALDTVQRETVQMRKFTENYLRRDGLFLLRLVAKNAGDLTSMEILGGLWENYGPKQRHLTDTYARKEQSCTGTGKVEVV